MDENQLIRESERGKRAKRILEDELWLDAWATLENALVSGWKTSPARDAEGREALWMALQMAGRVRASLESHMRTGQMAEMQLERNLNGKQAKRHRPAE